MPFSCAEGQHHPGGRAVRRHPDPDAVLPQGDQRDRRVYINLHVVEVRRRDSLVAACVYPVAEGMEIITNSKKVQQARKITLELILSTHKKECLSSVRSDSYELQKLCHDFKVDDEHRYDGNNPEWPKDDSAVHMVTGDISAGNPLPPLRRGLRQMAGHRRHRPERARL